MKRLISIFAAFIICWSMNAQSIPKIETTDISVSNLNIMDSTFFNNLDSLIFNSVCSNIKELKAKILNVYFRIDNRQNNECRLGVSLDNIIQISPPENFRGCFEYNGYLFLWYYDIPEKILSVSDKKRTLTYTNGAYIVSSLAEISFNYSDNKLELTGVCCYK